MLLPIIGSEGHKFYSSSEERRKMRNAVALRKDCNSYIVKRTIIIIELFKVRMEKRAAPVLIDAYFSVNLTRVIVV